MTYNRKLVVETDMDTDGLKGDLYQPAYSLHGECLYSLKGFKKSYFVPHTPLPPDSIESPLKFCIPTPNKERE